MEYIIGTKECVDEIVEYIEALPNGTVSTTNKVIHFLNPELPDDFLGLHEMHYTIYELVEERGIVYLDYSIHNKVLCGFPYDMPFEVVRNKQ